MIFQDFRTQVNENQLSFSEIEQRLKTLSIKLVNGTSSSMVNHNCESKHNVAIIVPYRDRLPNLLVFLNNMHEFLAKQQITYGLFLVEPIKGLAFNRGLLMNIGYLEAIKDGINNDLNIEWNCFIFHGLFFYSKFESNNIFLTKKTTTFFKMLTLSPKMNEYSINVTLICPLTFRWMLKKQMGNTQNRMKIKLFTKKFRYFFLIREVIKDETNFGGIVAFTKDQYEKVNGFSNMFFDWGCEGMFFKRRKSYKNVSSLI